MNIRIGEGLTPVTPGVASIQVEKRQKGGSEIGKERAEEIVGDFAYAKDVLDRCDSSFLTELRIEGRELVNDTLRVVGLGRSARPSTLVRGMPNFRETDTLGDIKALVQKACKRLALLDISEVPDEKKTSVDDGWVERAYGLLHNFDAIARLTLLDRKHSDTLEGE